MVAATTLRIYRTTNLFFKQIDSLINGIYRGKLDLYNIARTPEGLQPHLLVPRMKVRGLKTDVNLFLLEQIIS